MAFGGALSQYTDYTGGSHTLNNGSSLYSAAQRKAAAPTGAGGIPSTQQILAGQANNVNSLTYTPIDTKALAAQATEQAASNAAQSLALEAKLSPGVSSARTQLQDQTAAELAQGGNLPADVVNQVSRSTAGSAGSAGLLGSQGPLTAASLGLTALNLANSRRANAANLLAANPTPTAGLDPGTLASANIANTNAANNFALQKVGAQGNVAGSQVLLNQQNMAGANQPTTTISAMPYVPLTAPAPQSDPFTGLPVGQLSYAQQLYADQSNKMLNPKLGPGY